MPVDSEPKVALFPDQAPEAIQESVFVEDQVKVEEPPGSTDAGSAVNETVGIESTSTVVIAVAAGEDPLSMTTFGVYVSVDEYVKETF